MKLAELFAKAGMVCPAERSQIEIKGITSNSKRVGPGWLFVCLPGTGYDSFGERIDGERFIDDARSHGCAAVLSEKYADNGDILYTDDALRDMAYLCRAFYGYGIERLKLVSVTGTNGKTTTVQLLNSVFSAAGYRCATIGTLGCTVSDKKLDGNFEKMTSGMTTPDPEFLYSILAEMAKKGTEYVFIEASSHALARKKLDALTFECGIFTNLTRDHLDFHLNEENYAKAKARLVPLCKRFIVNSDDPKYKLICENGITCSRNSDADFFVNQCTSKENGGYVFDVLNRGNVISLETKLNGEFNVMNCLQASACAYTLGIDAKCIMSGISSVGRVPGRMERVELCNADIEVYIDYAHTPDALYKVLSSVGRHVDKNSQSRIVVLFGCGGERDRGKRKEMGIIASSLADLTVVTSDNSRREDPSSIINDIVKGIDKEKPNKIIRDRREAIKYVINESRSGDIIILAGKGHEKYEIDENGIRPFDEAEMVRKAWCKKNEDSSRKK